VAKKTENPNARPMTPVKVLEDLLKAARRTKNDVAEIAGAFGQKLANAVESKHLNRKAFRAVMAEDRMEPEKLAEFYDAQDYYRDVGLTDRAASAPKLPIEESTEDGEDEGGGKGTGKKKRDNVKPFPAPTSVAAE
jgi:hypothetical protein